MRFNAKHLNRFVLVGGTLVALSCAPGLARAQSGSASQAGTQVQAQAQVQAQGNFRSADWVAFEQFLDAHPDVAAALRANPDLIDDQNFAGQHPQFRDFCNSHPRIRQDADANRTDFHNWFQVRHELATMDQFLDSHPAIAKQLQSNPALVQDQNYLQNHPQLKTFLNNNPPMRDAFDRNPSQFMRLENRYENSPADQTQVATTEPGTRQIQNSNPGLSQNQVVTMDQFLDNHANLEKQLVANPSLLTNQNFLNANPDLRDFLNNNPKLRDAIDANPQSWAQRETRYENSDADERQDATDGAVNRNENTNPDLTRGEVATMDQFLDSNPKIAQQLQSTPSLINNQSYLKDHPQLQAFLNAHPQIQEEFAENPTQFMNQENRYENSSADQAANSGNVNRGQNSNPGLSQNQVVTMDQFLDNHANLEKQLVANPSLLTNQNFLNANPDLRDFLNSNPKLRDAIDANPQSWAQRETRYENSDADERQDATDGAVNRNENTNPDLTQGEVAKMDQFLDSNPKIAQQLQSTPSLINNVKYLNDHPQLRAFLNDNPQVREEFTENPSVFMQRESQLGNNGNGSANVATMDAYLDKHSSEARDLNAYPARINDSDYLSHHKDLDAFLKKHPEVREAFMSNPSTFMRQESSFDACAQLDDFLNAHKHVAKDLDQNPGNVKDADFLNHHKDLKHFFDKNPGVSDQFQMDPHGFWYREQRFEADRQMDAYFGTHRGVAKDLQKNPDRVKDAKYLDHHKDLKELMNKNPQIEEAANKNPSAFMQEQMKFHEQYKDEQTQEKSKVQERATVHPH